MRKKFLLVLVLSISIIQFSLIAHAQEDVFPFDGYKWERLSESGKLGYVIGFMEGVSQVIPEVSYVLAFQEATMKDKTEKPSYIKIYTSFSLGFDLSGITVGQFMSGLDNFYKDYRNKRILVSEAIWITKLEMKGAPQSFIDEEIRILRMPKEERSISRFNLQGKNSEYKEERQKWGRHLPMGIF